LARAGNKALGEGAAAGASVAEEVGPASRPMGDTLLLRTCTPNLGVVPADLMDSRGLPL